MSPHQRLYEGQNIHRPGRSRLRTSSSTVITLEASHQDTPCHCLHVTALVTSHPFPLHRMCGWFNLIGSRPAGTRVPSIVHEACRLDPRSSDRLCYLSPPKIDLFKFVLDTYPPRS